MKILIAVEDATYGKALAEFVSAHNWPKDVEFRILTVVEPIYFMAYGAPMAPDTMASLIDQSQQYSEDVAGGVLALLRKSFPDVPIDQVVVQGSPKDEITIAARDWPADMLLMGSHGRQGLQRIMLGSVSLAVCANAPCSVMIVRLSKDEAKNKKAAAVATKQKS